MRPTQDKLLNLAITQYGQREVINYLVSELKRNYKSINTAIADGNTHYAMVLTGQVSKLVDDLAMAVENKNQEENK